MFAVIGGSGLYALDGLELKTAHEIETPYGTTSATIREGLYKGQHVLFLPRHGETHAFLPHEINYAANIYALKQLGATRVLSVSAAGSLRLDVKPGDLALVSQYYDHTKGRRRATFFGDGMAAHVSTAHPACPALTADIKQAAKTANILLQYDKAYACVDGPRLGTRAESYFLRDGAQCDIVGMTNVPEAFLAREAQLAYCTLCVVTDFDCWMEDPEEHVSVDKVFEVYKHGAVKAKTVLAALLQQPFSETPPSVRAALADAVLTPEVQLNENQKEILKTLRC